MPRRDGGWWGKTAGEGPFEAEDKLERANHVEW